jgi:hypothetical protein
MMMKFIFSFLSELKNIKIMQLPALSITDRQRQLSDI